MPFSAGRAIDRERGTLGAFLGVYTPTILTILGTIMYLRSGWLTGHLGVWPFLAIIVLANLITLITSLSISSVATNVKVGTGGAYYIISRSLGLEIGGAIGLPLFLSQAFSVTLYAFGLAESLRIVWPNIPLQPATVFFVLIVAAISMLGAELALKLQIPIMILVGVSIVAVAGGAAGHAAAHGWHIVEASADLTFWKGFAVFFPAVTGVMAGLGLSGDLHAPMEAIPRGTIFAVLTGAVIYLSLPFIMSFGADSEALRTDPLVWTRIAFFGKWVIMPGLWGAIVSSAIGSMLGAPRTIAALAKDGLAPDRLTAEGQSTRQLFPSIVLSTCIALAAVLLGNLNAVAVMVTIFFLTVYGMMNIVAAIEALSGDASWRPKMRFPWILHLVGGLGCFGAMVLISPAAGFGAVVVEAVIWLLYSRKGYRIKWGDARRGLYESLIRWSLIRLARRPMTPRNWRPHILAFVSDPVKQLDIIRFGNLFSQERGVVTVCELMLGDLLKDNFPITQRKEEIQSFLDQEKLQVFAEVDVVESISQGIVDVAQANGMAGIESNTVLLGWPPEPEGLIRLFPVMRKLGKLGKSLVIARTGPGCIFSGKGCCPIIHVWWGGLQRNGDLMMLLAYLLTQNADWKDARIEVISIASNELMKKRTERYLEWLIPEIRIHATPRVIVKPKEESLLELIHRESGNAHVVFFGLADPESGKEAAYAKRLQEIAGDLQTVFFVKNSSLFMGDLLGANSPLAD
ncbi:MAG: amino acid permease [Acidobacteria bacterium]|nr:amino acid permease [Acidobacteriota bacterium]